MLKRFMALAVMTVLMLGCFTGCSQADMQYLNMTNEISGLPCTFVNGDYAGQVSAGGYWEYRQRDLDMHFFGFVDKSQEQLYAELTALVSVDGQDAAEPLCLVRKDGGVYLKVSSLPAFSALMNNTEGVELPSYQKIYETAFQTADFRDQYVMLKRGVYPVAYAEPEPDTAEWSELVVFGKAFQDYLTQAFEGFETRCVSLNEDAVELNVSLPGTWYDLCVRGTAYVAEHKDAFADTTLEFMQQLKRFSGESGAGGMLEEFGELADEVTVGLTEQRAEFDAGVDELYERYQESDPPDDENGGMQLSQRLYREDGTYCTETFASGPDAQKQTICNINYTPVNPRENKCPEESLLSEEQWEQLQAAVQQAADVCNPLIRQVEATWREWDQYRPNESRNAYLCQIRQESGKKRIFQNAWVLKDQLYVPFRVTAEALGFEVGWDEETQMGYVAAGDTQIPVDGYLNHVVYMVKARELEKLGCQVTYTEEADGQRPEVKKCTVRISGPES